MSDSTSASANVGRREIEEKYGSGPTSQKNPGILALAILSGVGLVLGFIFWGAGGNLTDEGDIETGSLLLMLVVPTMSLGIVAGLLALTAYAVTWKPST
jgi:hypothetical protein